MKKLVNGAFMTDIHFGRKSNSSLHNEDCLRFIDWFCEQAKESNCDYVGFLGDWNENRSSLNISTLNYSYIGAKKLNDLGIPVFFCVGNHDLYQRHTRDVYSTIPFKEFSNFTIINSPTVFNHIGDGALFSPYLFHDEYPNLKKYLQLPFWGGHFEFKGFKITGYNMVMEHGPDSTLYTGPKDIVSGHFHMRQQQRNITYIGNAFPMDFGDAGDNERGMMIYDHISQTMKFNNWQQCPKYMRIKLSDMLDDSATIAPDTRVHCIIDIPITYEEGNELKRKFADDYQLREFTTEESHGLNDTLTNTETSVDIDAHEQINLDDLVVQMLRDIKSDAIDNELLIKQYMDIKIHV